MGELQGFRPYGAIAAIRDCAIHMAGQAHERRTTPSRHGNRGTKGRILMSTERMKLLEERLARLEATYLALIDESPLNAGHVALTGGASLFRMRSKKRSVGKEWVMQYRSLWA